MVQSPGQFAVGGSRGLEFLGPLVELIPSVGEFLFQEADAPLELIEVGCRRPEADAPLRVVKGYFPQGDGQVAANPYAQIAKALVRNPEVAVAKLV